MTFSALNSSLTAYHFSLSAPIIERLHLDFSETQPDLIANFKPAPTLAKAVGMSIGVIKYI